MYTCRMMGRVPGVWPECQQRVQFPPRHRPAGARAVGGAVGMGGADRTGSGATTARGATCSATTARSRRLKRVECRRQP